MPYYFAYGSNLDYEQMKKRCSKNVRFIEMAYLENYRFVYDGFYNFRNGAVANIVYAKNSKVWGVLYEIDETCLKELDSYEGYPKFYGRKILKVKDEGGKEYDAWLYLREPLKEGEPSEEYRSIILRGARKWGLPEDYITEFITKKKKL